MERGFPFIEPISILIQRILHLNLHGDETEGIFAAGEGHGEGASYIGDPSVCEGYFVCFCIVQIECEFVVFRCVGLFGKIRQGQTCGAIIVQGRHTGGVDAETDVWVKAHGIHKCGQIVVKSDAEGKIKSLKGDMGV